MPTVRTGHSSDRSNSKPPRGQKQDGTAKENQEVWRFMTEPQKISARDYQYLQNSAKDATGRAAQLFLSSLPMNQPQRRQLVENFCGPRKNRKIMAF